MDLNSGHGHPLRIWWKQWALSGGKCKYTGKLAFNLRCFVSVFFFLMFFVCFLINEEYYSLLRERIICFSTLVIYKTGFDFSTIARGLFKKILNLTVYIFLTFMRGLWFWEKTCGIMLVCNMSVIQILSICHGRWWWPERKSEFREILSVVTTIPPFIGSHGENIFGTNVKSECFRILILVPGQLYDLGYII